MAVDKKHRAGLRRADSYTAGPASHDATSALGLVEPGQEAVNVATRVDIAPDGGYGWVCVACVFLINAHTWGVNSSWAVFLSHYLEEQTFKGATQFEYALVGGLSISQSLMISPMVTWSMARLGTKITLSIGSILVFGALFAASYATQIWHLFLSQGICFGFGMGFLYIPATAVLPQWFSRKRSLAVGVASSGAGLGGVAYNLITGVAVRKLGLPWTYRLLAFCCLGATAISALLMKDRNKIVKPKQTALDWREFGHIEVIFVIVWGFLSEIGYIVLLFSLPHYATTIGLSQSQGSVVGAVLNIGLAVSRPLVGYLSDRWGRINMATFMTASCGIFCLALWVPAQGYALLLVFALCAGTGCGTFWGTVSAVLAEVVGLQRLPTAFGIICVSLVAPTTFAEPMALQLVATSGYRTAQIFVSFLYLLAASSAWFLRSWKIVEIEQKAQAEEFGCESNMDRSHIGLKWLTPRRLIKPIRV